MCRLLTHHNLSKPISEVAPAFENVFVIYPTANMPNELRNFEYIGIRPEEVKLFKPNGSRSFKSGNPATRYFRTKKGI
jgi:hypothetical protein